MRKIILPLLLVFSLLAMNRLVFAAASPVTMLQSTSQKVINQLRKNKANLKNNPKVVFAIIYRILLPQIDRNMMAKMTLGRQIWGQANSRQRKEFINEFTKMLVRTYARALANYTDEKVEFYPVRGGIEKQRYIEVHSRILRQGGPAIPMTYKLLKKGKQWKVYDFSVEGVSIVQSFRSQFSQEIAQGGMKQLLHRLKVHNDRGGK